jgi:hypothetical protein
MDLSESESLHAVRSNEQVRKANNVEDLKSAKGVLVKIIDTRRFEALITAKPQPSWKQKEDSRAGNKRSL